MSDSIIYENEKTGKQIKYWYSRLLILAPPKVFKITYSRKQMVLEGEELVVCPVSERKDYPFTRFYDFYEEDQLNFRNGYKIVKGEENVEYFRELSGFSRKDVEHALKHTLPKLPTYTGPFSA
jgi:hypothetical protein